MQFAYFNNPFIAFRFSSLHIQLVPNVFMNKAKLSGWEIIFNKVCSFCQRKQLFIPKKLFDIQ